MKTRILPFALLLLLSSSLPADDLKPYILAGIDDGSRSEVQTRIENRLATDGFEVVGSYSPTGDADLGVICVTTAELKDAVAKAGGLRGFAAVLRVGLHQREAGVEVSYTNPLYWGNAYFEKDFPGVEGLYNSLDQGFRNALTGLTESRFEPFGSRKGVPTKKLQNYHYMISMPYFHDVVVLERDTPFKESNARIATRTSAEGSEVQIVYVIQFPDQKMALYGTALTGENGETKFLPKIDFEEPRHLPFLPYEMLVLEDQVVSLHGKYRIALSFPDLSMGTFMKIVSTPGDIADTQRAIVAK